MDTEMLELSDDENLPIGHRQAWWELVTAHLLETEGQLSLC